MIDSALVRNFRCFENMELHGLRRINIIVGPNSTGKTALLESIFLASGGSPELALRLRFWRGLGQGLQITIDRSSYESLWKDLFHSLNQSKTISIQLIGSPPNTRSLTISYKDQGSLTLPLDRGAIDTTVIVPVTFEWKDHKGELFTTEVKITREGLNLAGTSETVRCSFFSTAFVAGSPAENATRFSDLSKQNKQQPIIDALKDEFPYVENLSVETSAGTTMLYASVTGLPEKIPLGMVSGGVNKLVSLLLAVANYPQGLILVDEIENGFYHLRLPKVWSTLLRFCKQYDTQIFAATHSLECLAAVLPSIRESQDDFCLIRTEKANGECTARVVAGRQLGSAIEQEVEVR